MRRGRAGPLDYLSPDVTAASSRYLPVPPFTQAQADLYLGEAGAPGQRDAPTGAGRFAGGFTASAEQSSEYARWQREREERGESTRQPLPPP